MQVYSEGAMPQMAKATPLVSEHPLCRAPISTKSAVTKIISCPLPHEGWALIMQTVINFLHYFG